MARPAEAEKLRLSPERQGIINQAMALGLLESVVRDMNRLFENDG